MKTVLVYSGGMDSTTLLYDLFYQGDDLSCIIFDYKQKHKVELEYAVKNCVAKAIPYEIVDISGVGAILKGSSQTDESIPVPEGNYDHPSMKLTVVPNRNMILLAIAAAYGISIKADRIAYGAHAGDHCIYPDCRPEFVHAMASAFKLCDWSSLDLYAPYLNLTKGDICKIGAALNVPYEMTWTCYNGSVTPCGKCGSCTERAEAFEFAGIPDPAK